MRPRPISPLVPLAVAALVTACGSASIDDPTRNLRETAAAFIPADDVHAVVATFTLQNTGPTPISIVYSLDCTGNGPLSVRVYRTVGVASTLVWDSTRLPPGVACPTAIHQDTIVPANLKSFQRRILFPAILGDSLPAGLYTFTVVAALVSPSLPAELPAATLALTTAPIPLVRAP